MLDFIVGEKGKDGGWCHFLCKKRIIHLDNDLQQPWIDNASKFSRFNFNCITFLHQYLHTYYTCLDVMFTIWWFNFTIL
jgi:hypothetical protein